MDRKIKVGVMVGFIVLFLSGMVASAARAGSSMYKNYTKVNLGMNDFTGDLDDADYNAGFDAGATYGRYLGRYLTIEGGINFFQTNQEFNGSNEVAGSYTRKDSIFVSSLLATLKGEFPVGPVTLYGGAGVGSYFVTLYTDIETSRIGSFDEDDDDVVFGAHLVAGGYYDITPRIFAGIEGMYRWTGDFEIQQNPATVPVQVEGNLNGYAATVSAGFRF